MLQTVGEQSCEESQETQYHLLPTLSRSTLLTAHFLTFMSSWLFHQLMLQSSEQSKKLLTLTCAEDTENKIILSSHWGKGLLSSQLLCWVYWNILSFAKYKLLKFRRNSGATDQFSAVYYKWSCPAGRRGGGPVSPTHCRETLTTWTHTMFYIKGPLGLTLRGLRLKKQNKTSSL